MTEPGGGVWGIWLDLSITRRKLYHSVTDESGALRFRSRFVSECMAYLDAEGVEEYQLHPSPVRTNGLPLGSVTIRKD